MLTWQHLSLPNDPNSSTFREINQYLTHSLLNGLLLKEHLFLSMSYILDIRNTKLYQYLLIFMWSISLHLLVSTRYKELLNIGLYYGINSSIQVSHPILHHPGINHECNIHLLEDDLRQSSSHLCLSLKIRIAMYQWVSCIFGRSFGGHRLRKIEWRKIQRSRS